MHTRRFLIRSYTVSLCPQEKKVCNAFSHKNFPEVVNRLPLLLHADNIKKKVVIKKKPS